MVYLTEDIPSKSLTEIKLDNEVENIFIEINLSNSHISEVCSFYNFTNLVKGMLRRYIGHFLKKRRYEKIRVFWNELTEKDFFFYFKRSLFLIFLKI